MENKTNSSSGIFDILNEWSCKLPKNNKEFAESSISTLSQLGDEFKQRCTGISQPQSSEASSQPQETRTDNSSTQSNPDKIASKKKAENVPKSVLHDNVEISAVDNFEKRSQKTVNAEEKDVQHMDTGKPKLPSAFILNTDEITADNNIQFTCVYDFCKSLEKFCRSEEGRKRNLDIDRDWYTLLQECTTHNYERLMWIITTFKSPIHERMTWKQVVRRLMAKYDDPTRKLHLRDILNKYKLLLSIRPGEQIYVYNDDFARIAEELGDDEIATINLYLEGLPAGMRDMIKSTMQFDDKTEFKYTLLDIQQRTAVCIIAGNDHYVFYSTSAHLATSLTTDEVSNSNCGFHLLGNHSTTQCPDYTIVKFPHLDFMPQILTNLKNTAPKLITSESDSIQTDSKVDAINNANNDLSTSNDMVIAEDPNTTKEVLYAKEEEMDTDEDQNKKTRVTNVVLRPPEPNTFITQAKPATSTFDKSLQKQLNNNTKSFSTNTSQLATPTIVQTTKPGSTLNNGAKASIMELTASSSTNHDSTSDKRKDTSFQRIHVTPSGLTAIRSFSKYDSLSDNTVKSPPRKESSSFIPAENSNNKRPRDDSPEVGCYFHGRNATHTTKECRESQLAIPPRNSQSTTTSNQSSYSPRKQTKYNSSNTCTYCGDVFFPGHLTACAKKRRLRKP